MDGEVAIALAVLDGTSLLASVSRFGGFYPGYFGGYHPYAGYHPYGGYYGGDYQYGRYQNEGYSGNIYRGPLGDQDASLIARVQQRLARAGIYRGPIDGVFGDRTRYAIRVYERIHGLPGTGVLILAFS